MTGQELVELLGLSINDSKVTNAMKFLRYVNLYFLTLVQLLTTKKMELPLTFVQKNI